METILGEWEAFARELSVDRDLSVHELRDHARAILEAIAHDLLAPQSREEQRQKSKGKGPVFGAAENKASAAEEHGVGRVKEGFRIEEMVAEYRALRASVLRLWGRTSMSATGEDFGDMLRFNEAIDQAVAESISQFSLETKKAEHLFLGILGHDLRSPLGAITASAGILERSAPPGSSQHKAASIMLSSARQMSRLVEDLLDFTRTRVGQRLPIVPQPSDLGEIALLAVEEARAFHPQQAIQLDAQGNLRGQWDPARLHEVISNLLDNGIKYGSGTPAVSVRVAEDAHAVAATVHNMGRPVPAHELPHIFEPLHRAERDGGEHAESSLGLGLYIAREIVQAHGGEITVTSSEADGTAFTIRLPRDTQAAPLT